MLNKDAYSALIPRYNQPGPRYTSYPTVPNWDSRECSDDYCEHLKSNKNAESHLSLYVHLPFCRRLCTYCGCHRIISSEQSRADAYLDSLEREIELIANLTSSRQSVKQLHLGGGTPTFLNVAQLERLWGILDKGFDISDSEETAIEVHPTVTTREQLQALFDLGFRRISLGVQDLDQRVQGAINRDQTREQTEEVFFAAKEIGYESVNMDLVYGLPHQNIESFRSTVESVCEWSPDRLAVYSFAYIPNMFSSHRNAIKEADLPNPEKKMHLYLEAKRILVERGYTMIGMDHFAKPGDELAAAFGKKTLHRNFMGYTVLDGMNQLGLGASSISDFQNAYFQNEKDLEGYQNLVNNQSLASIRVKTLDKDDIIRRELIHSLMCYLELDLVAFGKKHEIDFNEYFSDGLKHLSKLINDGLVIVEPNRIKITELGLLFIRNIVMPFDKYLDVGTPPQNFSKTV